MVSETEAAEKAAVPSIVSRRVLPKKSLINMYMIEIYMPLLKKLQEEFNEDSSKKYGDLTFGNPHDEPIKEFAQILSHEGSRGTQENCSPSVFQYQTIFPDSLKAILDSFHRRRGHMYKSLTTDDIFITTGAFGGLMMAMKTFTDVGDAFVTTTPDYFGYDMMITGLECSTIEVPLSSENSFDLDVEAIQKAFTENPTKARVLLLTNPNNPTGKMYTRERLEELSKALMSVNEIRLTQFNLPPVVIISDEAYHRIIFPSTERQFVSPAEVYPFTVSIYSYAKTCMAPSERVGWIALSPLWPEGDDQCTLVRKSLSLARSSSGWLIPSSTNARCIPMLEEGEGVRVDLTQLQRRRDKLVEVFEEVGVDVFPEIIVPESGFYMLVRIPPNFHPNEDVLFTHILGNEYRILVMSMSLMSTGLNGWIRLSITGNDDMVETAVDGIRRFSQDYKNDGIIESWRRKYEGQCISEME